MSGKFIALVDKDNIYVDPAYFEQKQIKIINDFFEEYKKRIKDNAHSLFPQDICDIHITEIERLKSMDSQKEILLKELKENSLNIKNEYIKKIDIIKKHYIEEINKLKNDFNNRAINTELLHNSQISDLNKQIEKYKIEIQNDKKTISDLNSRINNMIDNNKKEVETLTSMLKNKIHEQIEKKNNYESQICELKNNIFELENRIKHINLNNIKEIETISTLFVEKQNNYEMKINDFEKKQDEHISQICELKNLVSQLENKSNEYLETIQTLNSNLTTYQSNLNGELTNKIRFIGENLENITSISGLSHQLIEQLVKQRLLSLDNFYNTISTNFKLFFDTKTLLLLVIMLFSLIFIKH